MLRKMVVASTFIYSNSGKLFKEHKSLKFSKVLKEQGIMNLSNKSKKLLFVVNVPEFFISHRLPLAVAAKEAGFDVHIASASGSGIDHIRNKGFRYHEIGFVRSGQNPLKELKTFISLVTLFKKLKPDLVHLITIKPVLYGGIAARFAGVRSVVAAVSGLGTAFGVTSISEHVRCWFVKRLYSAAFKHERFAVIFQNPDDCNTLLALKALDKKSTRMIRGSGVDLNDYPYLPESDICAPIVVMAARLLRDKGVYEFVEAARLLRKRNINVQMLLIGSPDPGNPTSVTQETLERWRQEGEIQVLGFRNDIANLYASANIVCLPSYYGEGLPKSLVEAAACGRAVVTTDHPGCRDAITKNVTGLLVPPKNIEALADAIQRLVEDRGLRKQMGVAGRQLAKDKFTIEKIVEQHMNIYLELLEDG